MSDITEKVSGPSRGRIFLLVLVAAFSLFLFLLMHALWQASNSHPAFLPVFLAAALVLSILAASRIMVKWE